VQRTHCARSTTHDDEVRDIDRKGGAKPARPRTTLPLQPNQTIVNPDNQLLRRGEQ